MGKDLESQEPKLVKGGSEEKEIKLSLFTAAVSATLRMAVPTIGLFMVGLIIDFMLQQTAFYAIIGAGIGFLIAAGLIYLQIKKLKTKGQDSLVNDSGGSIEQRTAKRNKENK